MVIVADGCHTAHTTHMEHSVRMVSGDMNNDGDDEIVVAFTSATAGSATEGSGSQAEVFRVDSATCFKLDCLELVGSFAFVLPSGPTAPATDVFEDVIDSPSTTTDPVYAMPTTRSPDIKLAIGTLCPLLSLLSALSVLCPGFGCGQGLLVPVLTMAEQATWTRVLKTSCW